jgi:hypothetical protein
MKNLKFFSYLFIILSTSFFTSCTRESIDYTSTAREIIATGEWSVDYYYAGRDKTQQFSNYRFNFIGNGTVTANSTSGSINGTWNIVRDVNRNEVLGINITEAHFQELNDHWTVTGADKALIIMKDAGSELRLRKL